MKQKINYGIFLVALILMTAEPSSIKATLIWGAIIISLLLIVIYNQNENTPVR